MGLSAATAPSIYRSSFGYQEVLKTGNNTWLCTHETTARGAVLILCAQADGIQYPKTVVDYLLFRRSIAFCFV